MVSNYQWILTLIIGLTSIHGARSVELTAYAQSMLNESMSFLDNIYDPDSGYLEYFYYPLAAGKHSTRSTVWYAAGLLQRNEGSDLEEAVKIITNVIGDQNKNTSAQWFGDYTVYPEQPTVGSAAYAPVIYNSWDPNWRGFIGTTLIVLYEEFGDILPDSVQDLILESMYNNTIGDSYRTGGVDKDNLYPAYSNPWLMRAVATGWTGRKFNDSNMTAAGEAYANELLDLFNLNNTLSEFNSPTYMGVSLQALSLWAKYMPADSVMGQNGPRLIRDVWATAASLYNANLKNLAAPWDRAYGYDTNQYLAIFSLFLWSLVGKDKAPIRSRPWAMTHADDYEIAPLIAVIAPYHLSLLPDETVSQFSTFAGEHTVHLSAYAPPRDAAPRNITAWLSANLTIGAESFDQNAIGGYALDPTQWTPVAAQWSRPRDNSVGFLTWRATESALTAEVGAGALRLTYPRGNSSSVFTFMVPANPLGGKRDIAGFEDVEGAKIRLSGGTVDSTPIISFCGLSGGTCAVVHGFELWNITYVMPADSSEIPSISLSIELGGIVGSLPRASSLMALQE